MSAETVIVESLKFVGAGGAGSILTSLLFLKYGKNGNAKTNGNDSKNGNEKTSGNGNGKPCPFHPGIEKRLDGIETQLRDLPMRIIEVLQKGR